MNKKRRNELKWLKYRKRIKRWVATGGIYLIEGEWVDCPNAIEAVRANVANHFRTVAVGCSCWGCSGYYKYRRHEQKVQERKLIQEGLQEFYGRD